MESLVPWGIIHTICASYSNYTQPEALVNVAVDYAERLDFGLTLGTRKWASIMPGGQVQLRVLGAHVVNIARTPGELHNMACATEPGVPQVKITQERSGNRWWV